MSSIIELLIGAILGSIASYFIPLFIEYYFSNKAEQIIIGEWLSTWQPKIKEENLWLTEKLLIKKSFFKGIKFVSSNNSADYNWIGYGKIFDKRFIIGDWVSTKLGAYAAGALILTIAARGDFMFGYDVGPDEGGKLRYRPFVVAKNEDTIEIAKDWIISKMNRLD